MYQYALPWFNALFCKSIGHTPPAPDLEGRLRNLNNCFTSAIYVNVCRGLFETHKLLFSFLLAVKILQVNALHTHAIIHRRFASAAFAVATRHKPLKAEELPFDLGFTMRDTAGGMDGRPRCGEGLQGSRRLLLERTAVKCA